MLMLSCVRVAHRHTFAHHTSRRRSSLVLSHEHPITRAYVTWLAIHALANHDTTPSELAAWVDGMLDDIRRNSRRPVLECDGFDIIEINDGETSALLTAYYTHHVSAVSADAIDCERRVHTLTQWTDNGLATVIDNARYIVNIPAIKISAPYTLP